MLEIAKCVATGTPLLGKFQSLKGNVLIIDEETGIDELWKRAKMLSFSEDFSIFFHIQCGFKLDNEKDLTYLLSVVRKNDISLIIFDPYVAMHNKAENSAEETAMVMEAMKKFNDEGAAVMYVHHLRKDSVMKFGYAQALRGSSALLGRLDSLIVVKKITDGDGVSDEIQILHEKSRRGKKIKPCQFSLVEEKENEKMVLVDIVEIEPIKRKIEQAMDAISGMFLDEIEELSRMDIILSVKKETGIGEKNISEALRKMVKENLLIEVQKGKMKHYRISLNKKDEGSEAVL